MSQYINTFTKKKYQVFLKDFIIFCRKDLTRTDGWELKPRESNLDIKFTLNRQCDSLRGLATEKNCDDVKISGYSQVEIRLGRHALPKHRLLSYVPR